MEETPPDKQLEKVPDGNNPPKDKKDVVTPHQLTFAQFKGMKRSYTFAGPLPPPSMLAEYNHIIPNGAERILSMAESQQNHRQHIEKTVIESDSKRSYLGLVLGFIIAMVLAIGGIYLIANGHSIEGLSGIIVPTGALAATFVYAQVTRKEERLARSKNATEQAIEKTDSDVQDAKDAPVPPA